MSAQINDGGPAFQHKTQWDGITPSINYHGISMRDYFAGKAIEALIVRGWGLENASGKAYEIADAMLRARECK
jgi:hypothetical protein